MSKPLIFMFSGQGSHYYQMGKELFEHAPIFRKEMLKGDQIFHSMSGLSFLDELYSDSYKKSDPFCRTLLTHPSIFMLEIALARTLMHEGVVPQYVLGASLGEFAAAVIAGVLNFEEALKSVIIQAHLIERVCPAGAMLAVFNAESYEDISLMRENSELAAFNFPGSYVVSGSAEKIDLIQAYLNELGIVFQRLAVSHAYHSSSLDGAEEEYLENLKTLSICSPAIPYISCLDAKPLKPITAAHFWNCVRQPIYFEKTIRGLEDESQYTYLDLGPSGTLATFIKYIVDDSSASQTLTLLSPFGQDLKNLDKVIDLTRGKERLSSSTPQL